MPDSETGGGREVSTLGIYPPDSHIIDKTDRKTHPEVHPNSETGDGGEAATLRRGALSYCIIWEEGSTLRLGVPLSTMPNSETGGVTVSPSFLTVSSVSVRLSAVTGPARCSSDDRCSRTGVPRDVQGGIYQRVHREAYLAGYTGRHT